MYSGFPDEALGKLRCPMDGAPFILLGDSIHHPVQSSRILQGSLSCVACKKIYRIRDGIVLLLDPCQLDAESAREQEIRNLQAPWASKQDLGSIENQMEMPSTIHSLAPDYRYTLLELGCGTGRYTRILADLFHLTMAVDFSLESLRILSESLDGSAPVGLVNADIARFRATPFAFERVLSTLTSNLPGPAKRSLMYALAAGALDEVGRFVYSVHNYRLGDRWNRVPKSGYYRKDGIYRYHFTKSEVIEESSKYFLSVKIRPIVIHIPFVQRLGFPAVPLSRIAEYIPLMTQLGELLLVVAENPMPLLTHGE